MEYSRRFKFLLCAPAFDEAGDVFHKPTADKLRKYILAPGNSTDRAEAYRLFRGRDPEIGGLLEGRGFLAEAAG